MKIYVIQDPYNPVFLLSNLDANRKPSGNRLLKINGFAFILLLSYFINTQHSINQSSSREVFVGNQNTLAIENYFSQLNSFFIGGFSKPEDYKLAVKGAFHFIRINIIKAGRWLDSAFKNSYQLSSLENEGILIHCNDNLPVLASMMAVECNGFL